MKVTTELLPEHPVQMLRAAETDHSVGLHHGEVIAFRCVECSAVDETLAEIVHDEDCRLAGQTRPTAYADRIESFEIPTPADDDGPATDDADPDRWLATDGGER